MGRWDATINFVKLGEPGEPNQVKALSCPATADEIAKTMGWLGLPENEKAGPDGRREARRVLRGTLNQLRQGQVEAVVDGTKRAASGLISGEIRLWEARRDPERVLPHLLQTLLSTRPHDDDVAAGIWDIHHESSLASVVKLGPRSLAALPRKDLADLHAAYIVAAIASETEPTLITRGPGAEKLARDAYMTTAGEMHVISDALREIEPVNQATYLSELAELADAADAYAATRRTRLNTPKQLRAEFAREVREVAAQRGRSV